MKGPSESPPSTIFAIGFSIEKDKYMSERRNEEDSEERKAS